MTNLFHYVNKLLQNIYLKFLPINLDSISWLNHMKSKSLCIYFLTMAILIIIPKGYSLQNMNGIDSC
jgi:hypothetical protein